MPISSEIADGLTEIEADFPATFIWNSTTYNAVASSESRAVIPSEYGMEQVDSLTLIVQMAQFGEGSTPSDRHKIIYNSRTYRIETIDRAPQNAFKIFRCIRSR